jgi:hypothetical protein
VHCNNLLPLCGRPFERLAVGSGFQEMLIILACIVGVLIGLTLNVFVLLPVILVGIAAYSCVAQGEGLGDMSAAIVVSTVSLQTGYFIGLTSREMVAQLLARLNIAQSRRI